MQKTETKIWIYKTKEHCNIEITRNDEVTVIIKTLINLKLMHIKCCFFNKSSCLQVLVTSVTFVFLQLHKLLLCTQRRLDVLIECLLKRMDGKGLAGILQFLHLVDLCNGSILNTMNVIGSELSCSEIRPRYRI